MDSAADVMRNSIREWTRVLVAVLLIAPSFACVSALPTSRAPAPGGLRLSELSDLGDPQRRASMRLVLEGLDYDAAGDPGKAAGRYDTALQLDPTNPYAYLSVARQRAAGRDPASAMSFIDRTESLLRASRELTPSAQAHLIGLRGSVWYATGKLRAGADALERARDLAPWVWRDGQLAAHELR